MVQFSYRGPEHSSIQVGGFLDADLLASEGESLPDLVQDEGGLRVVGHDGGSQLCIRCYGYTISSSITSPCDNTTVSHILSYTLRYSISYTSNSSNNTIISRTLRYSFRYSIGYTSHSPSISYTLKYTNKYSIKYTCYNTTINN